MLDISWNNTYDLLSDAKLYLDDINDTVTSQIPKPSPVTQWSYEMTSNKVVLRLSLDVTQMVGG